ncbi:MAG: hypothetical protein C4560_08335 [Nitrospiraceae bacterium]|nr:MAG: hypothetical protein C4560_08335 [Nitrospiraceae bacterium]
MKILLLLIIATLLSASFAAAKTGGGDITFEVRSIGNVMFSHDNHIAGAGLKCTDCHDALFITKEKRKTATMSQMQKGQSCGACHNGTRAFDVKGSCANCHKK